MGAAEDQHIYPVLLHLLQICLGSQPCHLVVCPAFFCKGYKQRAWLCEYSNRLVNGFYGIKICPALYSTFSAYYAYLFGLGYLNRPSCARFYYPNYGYWQFLLQAGQAVCRSSIAGNHKELYIEFQKESRVFKGISCNCFSRFRAVRHPCSVAEIDGILFRHGIHYLFQNSKTAYAGIKYTYGFFHLTCSHQFNATPVDTLRKVFPSL